MKLLDPLIQLSQQMLDTLLPNHCLHCGKPDQDYICSPCFSSTPFELRSFDFNGLTVWAATPYDGVAKTCLHHIKFEGHRPLLTQWTSVLNQFPIPLPEIAFDHWVVVPGSADRIRSRGMDVTDVLFSQWICWDPRKKSSPIRRTRNTRPLFDLSPAERESELRHAFDCPTDVTGQHIVLVDDILTVGTTLSACADCLYRSGAAKVTGFTLCHPLLVTGLSK